MTEIEKAITAFEAVQDDEENPILTFGTLKFFAVAEPACKEALAALREKQERSVNPPLTLEELRGMDGEPVWCEDGSIDAGIVRMAEDWATERKEPHIWLFDKYGDVKCYNIRLMLEQGAKFYRRPPEGETK